MNEMMTCDSDNALLTFLYKTEGGRGRVIFIILMSLAVAGCMGEEFSDIREFMEEVAEKTQVSIPPLPVFEPYKPFTYGAWERRSPFESIATRRPMQQQVDRVRPPENHVKQYLEQFPLTSLTMVGTMQKGEKFFALIEDAKGMVHPVQVGDFIGEQWGEIGNIDDSRISLLEIVRDGVGGWLKRARTIEIRNHR